jgi:SAM-dependent methyltransferase
MRLSTYKRLFTELYDIEEPHKRQRILDFYLKQAEGVPQPFLEPMCGTGYFLLAFLERGADIDGVDASPDMLEACRTKCSQRGWHPALYEQRVEQLDLPKQYGYILIPDRSFGHLYDRAIAESVLRRLYEYLVSGGRLVLDVAVPPKAWQNTGDWTRESIDRPDGTTILFSSLLLYTDHGRIFHARSKLELFRDGSLLETEWNEYIERFYEQADFSALLQAAGFTNIEVQQTIEKSMPEEPDRLVFIGKK